MKNIAEATRLIEAAAKIPNAEVLLTTIRSGYIRNAGEVRACVSMLAHMDKLTADEANSLFEIVCILRDNAVLYKR